MFAVNTDGTGFTNLYNFTNGTNGGGVPSGLVLSGNTLYGTTSVGGSFGGGTVFAIHTDGGGLTNLYNFSSVYGGVKSSLVLSNNILYGTTSVGGSSTNGTVFALNTDGTGFTNLHSFSSMFTLAPIAMERFRKPLWFCRVTHYMGRQKKVDQAYTAAAVRLVARCFPSGPMAQVLQTCIVSTAVMARFPSPVWFCRAILCMGQPKWAA